MPTLRGSFTVYTTC